MFRFSLLICSLLLGSSVWGSSDEGVRKLESLTCKNEILKTFVEWKALHKWKGRLDPYTGEKQFFSPTTLTGKWVSFKVINSNNVLLRLLSRDKTITARFDGNCKSQARVQIHQMGNSGFNDGDLKMILDKNKDGLIYVWSPGMPLSIEGIQEIQEVAKRLHLTLTFVHDAKADFKEVQSQISRLKIESRKLNSLELLLRGAEQHYPGLFIYKDSVLVDEVKYGFEEDNLYQGYIQRVFN